MILQRVILIGFLLLSIAILLKGYGKSNRSVSNKRKPVETWAIIGREFIEFTEEEIEWRSQNV